MKDAYKPKEKIPEQPSIPPMPVAAQPTYIEKCKYLLPCGICDKSGEICNQYGHMTVKIYSEVDENFGSWEIK